MGCLPMEYLACSNACMYLVQCMISHKCRKPYAILYMGKVGLIP